MGVSDKPESPNRDECPSGRQKRPWPELVSSGSLSVSYFIVPKRWKGRALEAAG